MIHTAESQAHWMVLSEGIIQGWFTNVHILEVYQKVVLSIIVPHVLQDVWQSSLNSC